MTGTSAKQSLRILVNQNVRRLSPESVSKQSSEVFQKLALNERFKRAERVALYMNMPVGEICTLDIIEHCFSLGKKVFLPRCNGMKMTFLQLESMAAVYNLQPRGKYGLLEPASGLDVLKSGDLDLILVPGVAFTQGGKRLGRGAGYYDKFLSQYSKIHGCVPYLIGLAFEQQLVDDLPQDDHDWWLDEVLVGSPL
ncbi:5-formyltetrahydrofolate cyclo-ligase [Candidozyma duobushaemuli]|nr:5-formyltetrahydrofolate cyclo-ligase [[Candida] duobushaemulonis]PVH14262.1 5-formyltetrahydrofolate cyclo-ligase [[Candida] duobushaemulonis]